MGSKPLIVAAVAAALVAVVVGVDLAMNRIAIVEVWDGSAWRELGRDPIDREEARFHSATSIPANASDEIRLRLRVDNGFAWPARTDYRFMHAGEAIESGRLDVPPRSSGEHEFTKPAARFLDVTGSRVPVPAKSAEGMVWVNMEVKVDSKWIYASFEIREVAK